MIKFLLFSAAVIFSSVCGVAAQARAPLPDAKIPAYVLSSPAYAEILLRRTEFEAEQEALSADYTDDFPRLREIRFILSALKTETARLSAVKQDEQSRLTLALGKLIIRKIEVETDLWHLSEKYRDEHPEVKRAKRKVEIFESAIKEILGG